MPTPQKVFYYIQDRDKLKQQLEGQDTVLVGGCFDILHYGHLKFLEKASQTAQKLVVALESDQFLRQKNSRDPIHTQEQRAEILSRLDLVDFVIKLPLIKGNKEYYELVKFVHPCVIALTKGDPYLKQKQEQAGMIHADLVQIDHYEGFSSSAIKQYAALSGY